MTSIRALAPGKVNLCLFLGPVRADGRHELVTLFESVSLADELELHQLEAGAADRVSCPDVDGENLVARALAGLRGRGWDGPPVEVEVRKRIPVAGGMGGGSADAAAALRMAVELVPGRPEEVASLAAALGADVPSQLVPGLVLGTGAGEQVEPFEPLASHAFVLVPDPAPLPTADVYTEADRLGLPRAREELEERLQRLVAALRPGAILPGELLVNELAPAAVSLRPAVGETLAAVREAGADGALVCGSGPTAAGIFWGGDGRERADAAAVELAGAYPGAVSATPVGPEFGIPRVA